MANDAAAHAGKSLGWHSRGYHYHLDSPSVVQSVGFRLADSVPKHLLKRWRGETEENDDRIRAARLDRLVSRFEDSGYGACYLRRPEIGALVEETLLYGDGDRYRLVDWCVMPNHVHVLVEPHRPLPQIVRIWKATSARRANRILRRRGPFWMADYFDRFIRDARHLEAIQRYIWRNPVNAGLCREPQQWPWSSARLRLR